MESSWWQRLEQELEQQFDRFLSDHPNQKELLDQEHWNEQQRHKHQRLLGIDQEAQDLRQRLLKLSKEISAWSGRVKRARTAGAHDLASRAETHLSHLMGQGRAQWQALASLGEEAKQLKQELAATKQPPTSRTGTAADLEDAWKRFEAEQELDELRRRRQQL